MSSGETSSEKNNPAEGSTSTTTTTTTTSTTNDDSNEKTEWPELVGKSVEEAKKVILKDKPEAKIVVVSVGSWVTMDYWTDRVRLFVDADTVAQIPKVG